MNEALQEQPAESLHDEIALAMRELDDANEEEVVEEEVIESEVQETEEEVIEESEEDQEEEVEVEALQPPEHWSNEDKETFVNATPEIQAWALRRDKEREADYTRKTQEVAETKRYKEQLDEILNPHRSEYQLNGLDDLGAIRQLMSIHTGMKSSPADTLAWLQKTYGYEATQDESEEGFVDPQIAELKERITKLQQTQEQSQQAQQNSQNETLVSQVQNFEADKDAEGNLKHPHFRELYEDMVGIIRSGLSKDLDGAYKKALLLRPDLTSQTTPVEKDTEAKKKEQAKQVKKAKKAASGVKGSGTSAVEEKTLSLHDQVEAAYDKASG